MIYGAPPYKAHNDTELDHNARARFYFLSLSFSFSLSICVSLSLSAEPRQEEALVKPKTARSRRSLFVEVSQRRGRANEPSLPFFFLHRVSLCSSRLYLHPFLLLPPHVLVLILFVLSAGTPRPSRFVFRVSLDLFSLVPLARPVLSSHISRFSCPVGAISLYFLLCISFRSFNYHPPRCISRSCRRS